MKTKEINLSWREYIKFKISYPFVNTSKLVRIPSNIKTPNVIQLANYSDVEIIKELRLGRKRLDTNNIDVYYLIPSSLFWEKCIY